VSALAKSLAAKQDRRTVGMIALAYLGAVAAAELLTTFVEPRVGLVLHAVLLLVLMVHAALTWERPHYQVLLALIFAPLIRMLSLSLPMGRFSVVYWYFITSVPLFAAALMAGRILQFSRRELGLNLRRLPVQLLITVTGLGFGYLEYMILRPKPLVTAFTWEKLWLPALILLVSTGFSEELIFRGLMQQAAKESLGRFSIPYVSLLFAVLHVGYRSLLDVVFVFAVALFFGYAVEKTESLAGVTLAHGLTNIVLFLVAPFVH
jgi:membrane protease YdiL (CAAX protease family)